MRSEIDFAGVVEFVEKRRKENGGYGATPRLPATIEESFEALAIAGALARLAPGTSLIRPPASDKALADYLLRALSRTWPGLRTTSQLIRAGRELGLTPDPDKSREYLTTHRPGPNDFHTVCHLVEIASGLGLEDYREPTWREIELPARLTVREALMFMKLRQGLGYDPVREHPELAGWLQRCQNGDGGFGFFPGTTSFIENCHYALAGLHLLGAKPNNPENGRRFLVSCQTGGGGLGRNPRSAPFLDATWHGLAALVCLQG